MPFKAKAACRRHIPKQQHRVINWAAYDASLRARGSLTVWFTTEAIEALRLQSMGWAAAFPRRRPHRDRLQYRRAKHAPGCSQQKKCSVRWQRRRGRKLGHARLVDRDLQTASHQSACLPDRRADQARQQLAQPPARRIAALGLDPRSILTRQAPLATVQKLRLR